MRLNPNPQKAISRTFTFNGIKKPLLSIPTKQIHKDPVKHMAICSGHLITGAYLNKPTRGYGYYGDLTVMLHLKNDSTYFPQPIEAWMEICDLSLDLKLNKPKSFPFLGKPYVSADNRLAFLTILTQENKSSDVELMGGIGEINKENQSCGVKLVDGLDEIELVQQPVMTFLDIAQSNTCWISKNDETPLRLDMQGKSTLSRWAIKLSDGRLVSVPNKIEFHHPDGTKKIIDTHPSVRNHLLAEFDGLLAFESYRDHTSKLKFIDLNHADYRILDPFKSVDHHKNSIDSFQVLSKKLLLTRACNEFKLWQLNQTKHESNNWDLKTSSCIMTLLLKNNIGVFEILPDGRLAIGFENGSVEVWNIGLKPAPYSDILKQIKEIKPNKENNPKEGIDLTLQSIDFFDDKLLFDDKPLPSRTENLKSLISIVNENKAIAKLTLPNLSIKGFWIFYMSISHNPLILNKFNHKSMYAAHFVDSLLNVFSRPLLKIIMSYISELEETILRKLLHVIDELNPTMCDDENLSSESKATRPAANHSNFSSSSNSNSSNEQQFVTSNNLSMQNSNLGLFGTVSNSNNSSGSNSKKRKLHSLVNQNSMDVVMKDENSQTFKKQKT